MAKYRPVDQRVWSDRRFLALSDDGRLLWLFLLTCPSSTPIPGVILGGDASLAEQLGWSVERFQEGFRDLLSNGFKVAREGRIVWLRNGLKYQPPAGPNAVKCWAGSWDDIPEGELKRAIWEALRIACKTWSVLFVKLFPEPLRDGLPNPSRNPLARGFTHEHEHEHEHEHDPEKNLSLAGAHAIPPSPVPRPPVPSWGLQSTAEIAKAKLVGDLAIATWQRVSEARMDRARALKLEGVLPLPVIHPGKQPAAFDELRARIREEGDAAHAVCDHVVKALVEQGDLDWLSEKAFLEGPWRTARSAVLGGKGRAGPKAAPAPSRPDAGPIPVVIPASERAAVAELAAQANATLFGAKEPA